MDNDIYLLRVAKWWVEPAYVGPRGGVHAAHIVAEFLGWRNGLTIGSIGAEKESGGVTGANRIAEMIVALHNATSGEIVGVAESIVISHFTDDDPYGSAEVVEDRVPHGVAGVASSEADG